MSFDLTRLNRYMPDEATDEYIADGVVNSYAPVTAISTNSITIDGNKKIVGDHKQFTVGTEIFIHVSGSRNGTSKTHLGYWVFAVILSVSGNVLTIDRDITGTIPARILSDYYIQALTVPFFTATANNPIQNAIAPPAFDVDKMCGGVLVIKAQNLYLTDHYINLKDRGIPPANKSLRPWFAYEQQGMLDTDPYAGWENAMLEHRLPLNSGDGAALIYVSDSGSITNPGRMGNGVARGVRFCRGASDSPNLPANVTNIGGSTMLIIGRVRKADAYYLDWACKYRSTSSELGQGLGARMFVTQTMSSINMNDGGLYAHLLCKADLPSALRLRNTFGDGSFGNVTDVTTAKKQMNNYALITTTSDQTTFNTKKISYTRKTTTGLAPIRAGALVLVMVFNSVNYNTLSTTLANVLSDDGSTLTLDKNIPLGLNRTGMIISVPQFKNFTFNDSHSATPKYNNGVGGIYAIAVSGTCDLRGGQITVAGKGGAPLNVKDPSLIERPDILTLGTGNGSIFILAKNLTMDTDTKLGILNTGNKLGGRGSNGSVTNGKINSSAGVGGGGYRGKSVTDSSNLGGYGGGGGTGVHTGGYCSSGTHDADVSLGYSTFGGQGAHLMIIADKITNFNINAIATGGIGHLSGDHGGAGYGGGGAGDGAGGGYRGGGAGNFASGGSAGYAFIYCNTAVNQITDGIILPE